MCLNFMLIAMGEVKPCRAQPGNCPFGGDESHFNTRDEAQEYADKKNEEEYGVTPEIKKLDPFSKEALGSELPGLSEPQLQELQDYFDLELETFKLTEKLKKTPDEYKATDEYFNKVQEVREIALAKYAARNKVDKFTEEAQVEEYLNPHVTERKVWKPRDPNKKSTYNFHPDITHENFDQGIGPVISAYSGKSMEEIKSEINELRGGGQRQIKLAGGHKEILEHLRAKEG